MKISAKFLIILAVLSTVAAGQNAFAKTIAVTSTADDGPGSLRQALATAANGDKINIVANGTIALTSGELLVTKNLTITGPGPNGIVSGNGASRVFHITAGNTVTISSLTIANGRASTDGGIGNFPANAGGGIYNDHAKLIVSSCTVSGNSARFGGGIFSNSKDGGNASLTINNSTISNNSVHSVRGFDGAYGGGIFSGGGFFNTGPSGNATLTLKNSIVSGNSAEALGGGILNDGFAGTATLVISNSTISGNSAADNFNDYAYGGGIYNNGDSGVATVTLTDTTLSDNFSSTWGGAVYNDGTASVSPGNANLSFTNCTLNNNSAVGGGGGGIYSYCFFGSTTVTLSNSALTRNQAGYGGGGIGFANDLGTARLTLTSCAVKNNSSNEGGGIGIRNAVAVLKNTTMSGNSALNFGDGGGITIDTELGSEGLSQVSLTNCTLNGNSAFAGGGIFNLGTELDLINCTISGNSAEISGGGIFNENSFGTATLTLKNSTVSGNSAGPLTGGAGGGIFNGGEATGSAIVTLANSTVSGNSAALGGGIANEAFGISGFPGSGTVTVRDSTLSGNSADFGGGIVTLALADSNGTATLDIANTILNAGVSGENIVQFEDGIVTSHGYNLSSDAAGGDNTTSPGGLLNGLGDIRNTNPLLGPLQNNGGPTMTHALMNHSPAVNFGDPNFNPYLFNPPLFYDQRGPGFPRVVKGRLDIGAFESNFH